MPRRWRQPQSQRHGTRSRGKVRAMSGGSFTRDVAVHTVAYIIAGSLAGLAALFGLGTWILGSAAAVWTVIVSAMLALWRGLTYEYSIPVWTSIPLLFLWY